MQGRLTPLICTLATVAMLPLFAATVHAEPEPFFENQQVYQGSRFPNIVVTKDGTVLAFRAQNHPLQVRRSEDGGQTWGPIIQLGEESGYMGAVVVDDNSGHIIALNQFINHDGAYRSTDDGKTWEKLEITIKPNSEGMIGVTHGSESGITLMHGEHAGRLIIASRSFGPANSNHRDHWHTHTTNAIYSDDGGLTWQTSERFPDTGTGESAVVELRNGSLYYNTRSHVAADAKRRVGWSHDGGHTWQDWRIETVLPDGPQGSAYGLMGGLALIPHDELDIVVYSNVVESGTQRRGGTVWLSIDGGETWPVHRLVDPGTFAYSSLAVGREGTATEGLIYLQYEGSGGLNVARFNLEWLLEDHPEIYQQIIPEPSSLGLLGLGGLWLLRRRR